MAWINEIKNPQKAQIITIKAVEKGLLLYTTEYEAFLWKNSKIAKDLLEALMVWTDGEHVGYELFVVPNKATKLGFEIQMGNEHTILLGDNLWTIDPNELNSTNPFLDRDIKNPKSSPPNPFMRDQHKKGAKKVMEQTEPIMQQIASEIASKAD